MAGFDNEVLYATGERLQSSSAQSIFLMQKLATDVSRINYAGNPNGVVSANPSSICHDPVSGNIYRKTLGTANTGWETMATPATVLSDVNVLSITGSNVSAFGDLNVAEFTPIIQLDFIYGINTQTGVSSVVTTGVVDTNAGRLRIQSGIGAAGSGTFSSARIARYRAGQGMATRFTGLWTTSAASSTQVIGVGNTQIGYFFGYNGTSFGISIRNGGSDTWVAQSAWNQDKCDGTGASGFNWNKTLGNVMQIQYPFLGYGNIKFWVEDNTTGDWILCHIIRYTNSSASLQLSNPSFPFYANATNAGSTTNLIMFVGSVGIFVSGERAFLAAQWATDSLKNTITTEANLLNLRNCTTYNTVTNSGVIRLRSISAATDNGNGLATIRLKTGVTLGGSPSFTTINGTTANQGVTITSGNSISSVDVAGTGTTGVTIFNICLARNSNVVYDLTPFRLFVSPGETLTVTAFSAASASIQVALNWNEDV
jgi:hypothetical protein